MTLAVGAGVARQRTDEPRAQPTVFYGRVGYGTIAAIESNKLEIDFDRGRRKVLDSFVNAGRFPSILTIEFCKSFPLIERGGDKFMEPFRGVLNIVMCAIGWLALILFSWGLGLIPFALWIFLVFGGSQVRRDRAEERLNHTLMPNETLRISAVQLRPFALFTRRKAIGITDSRIIAITRGLFGGFTMQDIQWKDLQDVEISENVLPDLCGSSLSFAFRKHDFGSRANAQRGSAVSASGLPSVVVSGVPCGEARTIYSNAQSQEQAWEEKRRIRAIEETRAAAGGVYLNTGSNVPGELPAKEGESLVEQLSGLKKLLDGGAITDVEFNEMKSKIIARA